METAVPAALKKKKIHGAALANVKPLLEYVEYT